MNRTLPWLIPYPAAMPDGRNLPAILLLAIWLGGCSTSGPVDTGDFPPPQPRDISGIGDAVPRVEAPSRYGNPASYVVNGKRYYTLSSSSGYVERGIASWYGSKFHGRRTSSGEIYDLYKMTAAHKTLPLPTYAEVVNLSNGRSVIVKINDRGPFHANRIIDLSYVAAARLGILEYGTGLVEVRAIDPAAPAARHVAAAQKPAGGKNPSLFLQVGAFRDRDNARRLSERLQASDLGQIHILAVDSPSGPLYRVRIGPLESVDDADRISNSLISLGINESRVIID
ncbi:MAG: septal ring lytic transglycosylase RlpA family protein [Gammaproteobacteria bacterium]